jgi:hypothetical protein
VVEEVELLMLVFQFQVDQVYQEDQVEVEVQILLQFQVVQEIHHQLVHHKEIMEVQVFK